MKPFNLASRFSLTLGASLALLTFAGSAAAAEATDNLDVTATVVNNCTISAGTLPFGNYDPVGTNAATALEGTGTISVTCTSGAATTITLGQGANADAGSTAAAPVRRMKDAGTNHLSYALFSDSGRTTIWGDDPTVDVAHTGTGAATELTVYGRVTAAQNVPAGAYTDTVVATITF